MDEETEDELQSELIEMGLNEKLMKKLIPEVQISERELMEQMDVDSQEKDDTITEPSGTNVLQDKVSEPSTNQTVQDDADDTGTSNIEMTDDVANPIMDLTCLPIASGMSLSQHLDAKTYQFLLHQGLLQEVGMPVDVDVQQQQQTIPLNMSMMQPSAQTQGSLHPSAESQPPPPP